MGHYIVPVVLVDDEGQVLRFPSGKAAGEFLGTTSGNVLRAALMGHKCHGYHVYRADECSDEVKEL